MSCKKYVHVHVQEKSLTLVTLNERSVNQYLRLAEQNCSEHTVIHIPQRSFWQNYYNHITRILYMHLH